MNAILCVSSLSTCTSFATCFPLHSVPGTRRERRFRNITGFTKLTTSVAKCRKDDFSAARGLLSQNTNTIRFLLFIIVYYGFRHDVFISRICGTTFGSSMYIRANYVFTAITDSTSNTWRRPSIINKQLDGYLRRHQL